MSTYTQEEIDQHYRKLPEVLREQLMSAENAEHIFEVGKKFALTIEQTGFLAEESGFVVLGLTHPKDFVRHLSERLGIDMEKTKAITQEINHHVFFPLRELLKNTHQFELTQEQIQAPPPPLPPISRPAQRASVSPQTSIPAPAQRSIPEIITKKPVLPPSPIPASTPVSASSSAPVNMPPPINIAELLKIKELTTPASPTLASAPTEEKKSIPLAPSQILQQKLGEEQKKPAPMDTPPEPPPPVIAQPPITPPVQKPSYPSHDPYREPIE